MGRIAFTPDERTAQAIERLSEVTGKPKAAIVTEMLTGLTEHIENIAKATEQVRALNAHGLDEVRRAAVEAGQRILPTLEQANDAMHELFDMVDAAEARVRAKLEAEAPVQ